MFVLISILLNQLKSILRTVEWKVLLLRKVNGAECEEEYMLMN